MYSAVNVIISQKSCELKLLALNWGIPSAVRQLLLNKSRQKYSNLPFIICTVFIKKVFKKQIILKMLSIMQIRQ